MIAQQIGVVICRVAAAVLIVQALPAFGFVVPALFTSPETSVSSLLGFIALGLLPALMAAALWFYAERIVGMPQGAADASRDTNIDETDLVRAGTLLIGLYLLVTGVIRAFGVEIAGLMAPEMPEFEASSHRYATQQLATRITYGLQILFGIALMVGRHRLAEFASRLRRAGT